MRGRGGWVNPYSLVLLMDPSNLLWNLSMIFFDWFTDEIFSVALVRVLFGQKMIPIESLELDLISYASLNSSFFLHSQPTFFKS